MLQLENLSMVGIYHFQNLMDVYNNHAQLQKTPQPKRRGTY
jgi:hypothetical protein